MRYAIVGDGGVVTDAPIVGPPVRVLAEVKREALAMVASVYRDRLMVGAEVAPGSGRYLDLYDPDDILSIALRVNDLTYPYQLTCTDGDTYQVSNTGAMNTVWKAALSRKNDLYGHKGQATKAIKAATTPEEVDTALETYLATP